MTSVNRFTTSNGRHIYTFPVQAFTMLVANIYVIDDGNELILVDCGSGIGSNNQDLLNGFEAIRDTYNQAVNLANISQIFITHGHIDHFGALPFVRKHTQAPIGVHVLDQRILSNFEERRVVASRRLDTFLQHAGVSTKQRRKIMGMYQWAKSIYQSVPTQFLLNDGEIISGIEIHHMPGHCSGQVCLRVDDILLTADHVLAKTTPHQAPESITLNMGLGHYLDSLDKIGQLDGIRLGLGGHEEVMEDVPGRVHTIKQSHQQRLQKILDLAQTPSSISDISQQLFGQVSDYHVLLALEEAGAHIEYLYQRGELAVTNLDDISQDPSAPFLYQKL